jgi:hypothetical protein
MSVYSYLHESYPGLWTMKPSKSYVKELRDPYEDTILTEFDGLIIMSNDPQDFKNPLLNVMVDENKNLDQTYKNYLLERLS